MEQNNTARITLAPGGIESVVRPLRLVFWGGIFCVFDFKLNGVDVLNDVLGALLIAWGVLRLGSSQIHERYRQAMLFVQVMALLYVIQAVNAYVRYEFPRPLTFLLHVYGIAKMAATVVFCMTMRWMCIATGLTQSEQSWKTTEILFAVIYLIPWGLLHVVWIICLLTGDSFNLRFDWLALPLIFVFFVPIIHLLVSTSRMRAEAHSISHHTDKSPPHREPSGSVESRD
ncbi:MAG: hypothetical protein JSW27_08375 [Phycisphaerales bacterium]|nr:MAG: hypothetical protein JSW27_08375 [Phycisphaerales bacterium]